MAALLISFSAAFKISWRTTEPQVVFLPLSFPVEYGHTTLSGTTAVAHLQLAPPECTNTGKRSDKCAINPKLANASCVDEAVKFA